MKFTEQETELINAYAIHGTNIFPIEAYGTIHNLSFKSVLSYFVTHPNGFNPGYIKVIFTSKHNCKVKREYFDYIVPTNQEMSHPTDYIKFSNP